MAYSRRSQEEIEAALRKHDGLITRAAKELNVSRETVRKRILKSKRLQEVQEEIRAIEGDICEFIIYVNLKLAVAKADRINKMLALAESDDDIFKIPFDKEGTGLALKLLKTAKHQDRGYSERNEVTSNVNIPKIEIEFVKAYPEADQIEE